MSGARPLRVALVDPSRQAPAYVRQLGRALSEVGCDVSLLTAPLLYDVLEGDDGGVAERLVFGRLLAPLSGRPHDAGGRQAEPRPLPAAARSAVARRALRAATYPAEAAGVAALCLKERPDIVHLQWSLAPPLDGLWLRALRRAAVPVVYTAHNVVPHEPRPWHPAFHRWLQGAAHVVIAHSRATRERLIDLGGVSAARVAVVPMPADEPESRLGRAEARASLSPPLPPDAPVVLFFGHVRPYKGLETLIDAVPRLLESVPAARIRVCGPVSGGHAGAKRITELAASRGVASAVYLRPGYMPAGIAAASLAAADVVVLPYVTASDSAVLAGARGRGRAVVATDVPPLAEALEAGGGIVVPRGDPAQLADALAAVLGQPDTKARLEREARDAAAAWTWRDAAEATVNVYRAAAGMTAP
ncbi:MAG: glycosyltransferase [Anaerolineae bacterium]